MNTAKMFCYELQAIRKTIFLNKNMNVMKKIK